MHSHPHDEMEVHGARGIPARAATLQPEHWLVFLDPVPTIIQRKRKEKKKRTREDKEKEEKKKKEHEEEEKMV